MQSNHNSLRRPFQVMPFALLLLMILINVLWLEKVHGQGFIIPDREIDFRVPRPWQPDRRAYRIRELSIDANIKSPIATTTVTQVFENTGDVQIEATFVFPIPYDGAVDKMTFLVDGKELEAKLLPADKARQIYEGYVRRNQDPALLEWVGHGMFRSSVFPIPPGQTRTVTLRYSQLLRSDNQVVDYLFPMSTAKYTSQPLEKVSLRVSLSADEEIKSIYSPTHNIEISREGSKNAVVRLTAANVVPNADFRLVYDTAPGKIGASVLSYWPQDEDQGYFVMFASPQINPTQEQPLRKSVIFVVDQSGSMSGEKMEQARQAAKFVLNSLREDDLFNIIRYESRVVAFTPELERFNAETRDRALHFINSINAGGGTNIDEAVRVAMGMVTTAEHPSFLLFLTDGMPTVGEVNELKIAQNCAAANAHRARLISFGVGYDVNSRLLDRLSRENFGQSEYIRPNEDIEVSVSNLSKKIASPILANVDLQFKFAQESPTAGEVVNRVYPSPITDLFAGVQLVVVGRYRQAGAATVLLKGKVGDQDQGYEFPVEFAERGSDKPYPFVRQLWASRRIGEILDLIDLQGKNNELIGELTDLSIRYGIVTPYTSYLADENEKVNQLADSNRNFQTTDRNLSGLQTAGGRGGFEQRSFKGELKAAMAAELSPGMGGQGGMGGMGFDSGGQAATGRKRLEQFLPNSAGIMDAGDVANDNMSENVSQGVRKVGNMTLYKRGKLLIAENATQFDLEKDANKIKNVKRFSDEYFELASKNSADENRLIAEQGSEELLIVLRGQAYLIQ